mmetsp:Transcript_24063/g.74802  ORF Transcript_24063/g.74802 Transcript_24063/m.74802 type:complete len:221 (+) Transcript_24063:972-1634(+)
MTWSWRTSVASVKFRMSQNPKIASTRLPGTMAFSAELSPPCMFWPMISAPASPKPSASREPIFTMVFSRTTVSMGSGCSRGARQGSRSRRPRRRSRSALRRPPSPSTRAVRFRRWAAAAASAACSRRCSSSPMLVASRGLLRILSSLETMRSMGASTSLLASLEKVIAPKPRRKQMKIVCAVLSSASIREPLRRSKTNMKKAVSHSASVARLGYTTARSW